MIKDIDKKLWKPVAFGDMCKNLNDAERQPLENGIDRYVGLEHLETENLHIKSWGNVADGTTFTKRFSKGHILFGKRRAYLRKAALANFDGICSGDILVFEANKKIIDPTLLPFIVSSDRFFDYAVQTSAGSLSPRTKFQDLAKLEFLLPPKEQQAKLAELLWAADEVADSYRALARNLITLKLSLRVEALYEHSNLLTISEQIEDGVLTLPEGWTIKPLTEVCSIKDNLRKPINRSDRTNIRGIYPYYGPTGVLDYINEYRLEGEYTLIGEDGDHFLKYNDWDMTQLIAGKSNVNNHAHIIQGSEKCHVKWVHLFYQHRNIIPFLKKQGATRYKLTKETLSRLPIIIPPPHTQEIIIKRFEDLKTVIMEIESNEEQAKKILSTLLTQIFS